MSDLYALPTGEKSCALLMMLGYNRKEVLWYNWCNDPHLAKYNFMAEFECGMAHDYNTGMHYYISSIEFGEGQANSLYQGGYAFPIRADLNINVRDYNRIREPILRRYGANSLPEFITLER